MCTHPYNCNPTLRPRSHRDSLFFEIHSKLEEVIGEGHNVQHVDDDNERFLPHPPLSMRFITMDTSHDAHSSEMDCSFRLRPVMGERVARVELPRDLEELNLLRSDLLLKPELFHLEMLYSARAPSF